MLVLIPCIVVINSMRGKVCARNITKCLSRHARSISTMLKWYILQHDRGAFDYGIDGMVDHNPMRQFEKSCLSHLDGSLCHTKFW